MEKIEYKKRDYKGLTTAYSVLTIIPPLGILFIIVDWCRGAKVNFVSALGVFLGVVLSVVYYMQLTSSF